MTQTTVRDVQVTLLKITLIIALLILAICPFYIILKNKSMFGETSDIGLISI